MLEFNSRKLRSKLSRWSFTAVLMYTGACPAETVSSGTYIPAPDGINVLMLYLMDGKASSFAPSHGSTISGGTDYRSTSGMIRHLSFFDIAGVRSELHLGLPFGEQDVKIGGVDLGRQSGVYDPFIGFSFWPVNDTLNKRYFGLTSLLYVPLGSYRYDASVNMGGNRYVGVFQAGYTQVFTDWQVDVIGDTTIYGDNDESGLEKGRLEQDDSYSLQTWLTYKFTNKASLSVGGTKNWGGESFIDGSSTERRTDSLRGRLGFTYWASPKFQVYTEMTRDIEVRGGYKFNYSGFLRLAFAY